MQKTILFTSFKVLSFAIFVNLLQITPSEAKYTINLNPSLNKSDIPESCKQVFFSVINEIDSKEPQDIGGYLSGNKHSLELALTLTKNNVMVSRQLQTYWSNTIHQSCPTINQISFGKYRTDWIQKYVARQGKMIAAFKEEPDVLNYDYKKAREIIVKAGWKPVDAKRTNIYGGYLGFVSSEYPEVYDCAGTGLSPCIFFFENPDDNYYLKIITAGQFNNNYSGGKINFIEVRSSMGGAEYETHMLYQ